MHINHTNPPLLPKCCFDLHLCVLIKLNGSWYRARTKDLQAVSLEQKASPMERTAFTYAGHNVHLYPYDQSTEMYY